MKRSRIAALLLASALLASAACADNDPPEREPIVEDIPWTAPEAYRYELTTSSGGDPRGEGVLSITMDGDSLLLSQMFSDPEGNADSSVLEVEAETLAPLVGRRVITDADEDRRAIAETEYGPIDDGDAMAVRIRELNFDSLEDDEPSSRRCNPMRIEEDVYYDNDSSLFLWRTIKFEEGYEVTYSAVIANRRDKRPVTLRVRRQERIETAAGEFDAWLVGIEAEGQVHNAYFATTDDHKLLWYDNDDLTFSYAGEAEDVPAVERPEGVPTDCGG